MIPVKSQIHPDELHDKYVHFDMPTDQGQRSGVGKFLAERNGNGFDYIAISHEEQAGELIAIINYPLPQGAVDAIRRQEGEIPFYLFGCLASDPASPA